MHVLLHVLEERDDGLLRVRHLRLQLLLLTLVPLGELVDLLLLRVEHLELLLATHAGSLAARLVAQLVLNVLDVPVVVVDDLSDVRDLLVRLFLVGFSRVDSALFLAPRIVFGDGVFVESEPPKLPSSHFFCSVSRESVSIGIASSCTLLSDLLSSRTSACV